MEGENNPQQPNPLNKIKLVDIPAIKTMPKAPVGADTTPVTPASSVQPKFNSAPAIKTFKSDIAQTVQKDHVSLVQVALAESRKREQAHDIEEATSPVSKRNLTLIISSVILIVIALGAVGYFYWRSTIPAPTVDTPSLQQDIIFSESSKNIPLNEVNKKNITSVINNERGVQLPLGSVLKLQIASSTQIPTSQFIDLLFTRMPAALERSFDNRFFLGIHSFSTNEPFLILPVNNHDTAYAGMLAWEKDMSEDIGSFFTNATSSAAFKDKVIENKDTRVLMNDDGKILFFYTFVDEHTLVITTAPNTLKEIIIRLNKPKLIH
jgi:hypothetical protein